MSEGIAEAPAAHGLRFGPLGEGWVHLCIDMQRMFAEETEWHALDGEDDAAREAHRRTEFLAAKAVTNSGMPLVKTSCSATSRRGSG